MKNKIVLYKSPAGNIDLKVNFDDQTVWLTQDQMASLFATDRTSINKHLINIFKTLELNKDRCCAKIAQHLPDGRIYQTLHYNLDAIISVGYRVNSSKATQFRIWATKVLRNYLVKGYAINQKRVLEQKKIFEEFKKTVDFVTSKSKLSQLKSETDSLLSLISDYTNSIYLLTQYDDHNLNLEGLTKKVRYVLTYEETTNFINEIRNNFGRKLSSNFGQENGVNSLAGIIGAINQTFDGKYLYSSVEEQAANLLYMVIKDHTFVDGNKRIGSTLFVYYLNQNRILKNKLGENKISDRALVALALLIATSNPSEKDDLIKLVVNLIK